MARRDGDVQLVLADYSASADLYGYDKFDLAKLYVPSLVLYFIAKFLFSGVLATLGWILLVITVLITTIGVLATPDHMGPVEYLSVIIRHYTRQHVLLHDRDTQTPVLGYQPPEYRPADDPENDS
ncbi:hypothetical protein DMJ13_22145 [halophilic archaeon]|nr:hypothetical protein DMJ13_22145 [halophilic archaeon]